ncbi:MAG: hypothetical protein QM729_14665 [Solirubrobacterales bacterium]
MAEELLPETTYHYRVIAHSDAGTTVGPDQTLTTGPEVSPEEEEEGELHALAAKSWKGFFNLDWSGKSYEIKEEMNMVEKAGATTFRYAFNPDLGNMVTTARSGLNIRKGVLLQRAEQLLRGSPTTGLWKYRKSWYAFQEKAESPFLGEFP